MTVRSALRTATAEHHDRVDRLFSSLRLADPADYRLFLLAQAAAHLPIEAAIDAAGAPALLDDWSERRRADLLKADLAAMAVDVPLPESAPPLADAASILGAIYVLEGSRLGAALLKRSVSPGLPMQFLAAPQPAGAWRKLLAKLDLFLYEPAELETASQTARHVFERFEKAGRRYLETIRA